MCSVAIFKIHEKRNPVGNWSELLQKISAKIHRFWLLFIRMFYQCISLPIQDITREYEVVQKRVALFFYTWWTLRLVFLSWLEAPFHGGPQLKQYALKPLHSSETAPFHCNARWHLLHPVFSANVRFGRFETNVCLVYTMIIKRKEPSSYTLGPSWRLVSR